MLDVLIKNANIIDGTGKPAYKGSIGISGGKLVMADGSEEATAIIDASGKYVSPGWIDAHSHGDLILGSEDAHLFKTTQGVTTELTGQCGLSMAPVMPENLAAVQNMLSMGTTWFPDDMKNWSSFARFLEYADQQKLTANAKMYIGHSSLRIAVMGMANRPATDAELDRMKGILREAMEDGAAGFSTGLIYTPSCYAEEKEIIELAKVIAPFNGIYASHMRNESDKIVEAVEETINVGRQAGVLVDISHHKMLGKPNWGKQKQTPRPHAQGPRRGHSRHLRPVPLHLQHDDPERLYAAVVLRKRFPCHDRPAEGQGLPRKAQGRDGRPRHPLR